MKCPVCKSAQNKVVDSRDRGNRIYRRRKCLECNVSFTTYEITDELLFRFIDKLDELEVINNE